MFNNDKETQTGSKNVRTIMNSCPYIKHFGRKEPGKHRKKIKEKLMQNPEGKEKREWSIGSLT